MNHQCNEVCSVTQMAKKVGLSRPRFYQLQKLGVFPPPVYCLRSKSPFYTSRLQQQCLAIRQSGIGMNGLPIIFYSKRQTISSNNKKHVDQIPVNLCRELQEALQNLGLKASSKEIYRVVSKLYPDGIARHKMSGDMILNVYKSLNKDRSGV